MRLYGYGHDAQGQGYNERPDARGQHAYYGVEGGVPYNPVQDTYGPVQPGGYGGQYDQAAYNQHSLNNTPSGQQRQEQPTRNGVSRYDNHPPSNGHHNQGYPIVSGNENYRGHPVISSQQPRKGPPKEQRRPAQSKPG